MQRRLVITLLASLALTGLGAAAAQGGSEATSTGATASALAAARLTFYQGVPGAGGTQLATTDAASLSGVDISQADHVVIDVGDGGTTFALDTAAAAQGQVAIATDTTGPSGTSSSTPLQDVVQELYRAHNGDGSLVLFTHDEQGQPVVVGVYQPDAPDAANQARQVHLRTADHATVWMNGSRNEVDVAPGASDDTIGGFQVRTGGGKGPGGFLGMLDDLRKQPQASGGNAPSGDTPSAGGASGAPAKTPDEDVGVGTGVGNGSANGAGGDNDADGQ